MGRPDIAFPGHVGIPDHKRNAKQTTRVGNSVVLERPNDISALFRTSYDVVFRKRLLMMRKEDIPSDERGPGSWVVSIRGVTEEQNASKLVNPAAPLVAVVTVGTGNTSLVFEVDAWNTTFSVPADDVSIDIGYSQWGTDIVPAGAGEPNDIFNKVRVDATAHRSLETGESIPTRSFYMFPANGAPNGFPITIPTFGASWTVAADTKIASGTVPYSAFVSGGGYAIDNVPDDVLASMVRTQCFRPLPGWARSISNAFGTQAWGTYIFRIGV